MARRAIGSAGDGTGGGMLPWRTSSCALLRRAASPRCFASGRGGVAGMGGGARASSLDSHHRAQSLSPAAVASLLPPERMPGRCNSNS